MLSIIMIALIDNKEAKLKLESIKTYFDWDSKKKLLETELNFIFTKNSDPR